MTTPTEPRDSKPVPGGGSRYTTPTPDREPMTADGKPQVRLKTDAELAEEWRYESIRTRLDNEFLQAKLSASKAEVDRLTAELAEAQALVDELEKCRTLLADLQAVVGEEDYARIQEVLG